MQNDMSKALSALRKQVEAGLSHGFDNTGSPKEIVQPAKIGELFSRAEVARDELRHSGFRHS